jgi:hypothetical protein
VGEAADHGKVPPLELSENRFLKKFSCGKKKKFRRLFFLRLCTKIEKSWRKRFLASIIGLIAAHVDVLAFN